jgi:hypothetical protein
VCGGREISLHRALVAYRHLSGANLDRRSWTSATAAAPSPIAPPTRFTDAERTSPTAYTPGTLDSSATGARQSAVWRTPRDNEAMRIEHDATATQPFGFRVSAHEYE